ncbi:MAG: hypothetical protein AB7P24_13935 [Nitrospira sp.]
MGDSTLPCHTRYDAVGKLLSITLNTGVCTSMITALTPNISNAGKTANVSLIEKNLTGSSLATDNPGILVCNLATSPTTTEDRFITPRIGVIKIQHNTPVTVSFSRPVDRTTITTSTFAFTDGATPRSWTVTFWFGGTVLTFRRTATLACNLFSCARWSSLSCDF